MKSKKQNVAVATSNGTWPHIKDSTYVHALNGGNRIFKVKKESLKSVLDEKTGVSQFEKHLIQEGIKQVLFAGGTDDSVHYVYNDNKEVRMEYVTRCVPKEMIQFLLDHGVIEINPSWENKIGVEFIG